MVVCRDMPVSCILCSKSQSHTEQEMKGYMQIEGQSTQESDK